MVLALTSDVLLIADSFQYSRQSYQNRARVRTPQGWQWLTVPIAGGGHGRRIDHVLTDERSDWRGKHLRALQHNYGSSAFFPHYAAAIRGLLRRDWLSLGALTSATTHWLLEALSIETKILRTSELTPVPETARQLATLLGNAAVVSLQDSVSADRGSFPVVCPLLVTERPRHQNFGGFVSGMSALDLLFNYGPDGRTHLAGMT